MVVRARLIHGLVEGQVGVGSLKVLVLILILANAFTGEREVHRLRACER